MEKDDPPLPRPRMQGLTLPNGEKYLMSPAEHRRQAFNLRTFVGTPRALEAAKDHEMLAREIQQRVNEVRAQGRQK